MQNLGSLVNMVVKFFFQPFTAQENCEPFLFRTLDSVLCKRNLIKDQLTGQATVKIYHLYPKEPGNNNVVFGQTKFCLNSWS